nr:MAG TPA: hypothetical protein [Crassvirales sp.]
MVLSMVSDTLANFSFSNTLTLLIVTICDIVTNTLSSSLSRS